MTVPAPAPSPGEAPVPLKVLVPLCVMSCLILLGAMLRSVAALLGVILVLATDGVMAGLLLLAAGGYGRLLYRRIAPAGVPRLLDLATSCALGLMLLSSAVAVVGSLVPGSLTPYVWWPVVAAGAVAAMLQAHRALGKAHLPAAVSTASLVWLAAALAAGLWLAGAVLPPGWLGNLTMDSYDVLEYHLQLPREYFQAGAVRPLGHNVYSHYPLGVEMLYLLAMCLRGGAYEGAYLAQLVGGLFGLVMLLALAGGAAGGERREGPSAMDFRAAAAVALLATAPWVIYLSWLAMVELPQMCFLAVALLWLRRWLSRPEAKAAACIGLMLGGACATKYLSVGFVAGPVLVVMAAACLRRPARLGQAALAGALALLVFSPWLVRNLVATGNPVFPLATGVFGKGSWSEESARRWRDGHAADLRPPVPVPPDYRPPEDVPTRRDLLAAWWTGQAPYNAQPATGQMLVLVLLGTVLAMFLRPRRVGGWDWALLGMLAMQLAVWIAFTRGMPARFISAAVVPMSLLAAGGLARLAGVREAPFLRQSPGALGRWGLAPAGVLLAATAALNLASVGLYYRAETARYARLGDDVLPPVGADLHNFAGVYANYAQAERLGPQGRLMLVGDAAAFYYPPGTLYATVFDAHPFLAMLGGSSDRPAPAAPAEALRAAGVTHVQVTWAEIRRLMYTYGWPAEMAPERLQELFSGWPLVDEYFRPMTDSGPAAGAQRMFTLYAVPAAEPGG